METIVWAISVPLMFGLVLVLGIAQSAIPSSTSAGRQFLYTAAPGFPAFSPPLALYLVLAVIALALSIVVAFPRLRSGLLQPWFLIAQNIVFGLGDLWVAGSYSGAPGWPEQAWIASIVRAIAAVFLVIVVIRERMRR